MCPHMMSCRWGMFSMGRLLSRRRVVIEHNPCIDWFKFLLGIFFVMVGFVQKSFNNTLSMSSFSSHLCSWCVWFAIMSKLWSLSCLRMYFPRCLMGPLSGVYCMECHQSFWKSYGVRCACSYGVAASLWSNSCPCLASAFVCSLPSIFVWVVILWSVVICKHDISILTILSSMLLYGCLIWVFKSYSTFKQYVNIWVGSSWYVVVRSCRMWCMALIYARSMFCSPGSLFAIFRFLKGL